MRAISRLPQVTSPLVSQVGPAGVAVRLSRRELALDVPGRCSETTDRLKRLGSILDRNERHEPVRAFHGPHFDDIALADRFSPDVAHLFWLTIDAVALQRIEKHLHGHGGRGSTVREQTLQTTPP